MRYLDQFVRIAAKNFEDELARVARTDSIAKQFSEDPRIAKILVDIKSGAVAPPTKEFEPYGWLFFPDSKYSSWASNMLHEKNEEALFTACASLSNALRCRNDTEFSGYCKRCSYTFPDGWPDDPDLYAKTIQQESLLEIRPPKVSVGGKFGKIFSYLVGRKG
jgi:hypothetical protein